MHDFFPPFYFFFEKAVLFWIWRKTELHCKFESLTDFCYRGRTFSLLISFALVISTSRYDFSRFSAEYQFFSVMQGCVSNFILLTIFSFSVAPSQIERNRGVRPLGSTSLTSELILPSRQRPGTWYLWRDRIGLRRIYWFNLFIFFGHSYFWRPMRRLMFLHHWQDPMPKPSGSTCGPF